MRPKGVGDGGVTWQCRHWIIEPAPRSIRGKFVVRTDSANAGPRLTAIQEDVPRF